MNRGYTKNNPRTKGQILAARDALGRALPEGTSTWWRANKARVGVLVHDALSIDYQTTPADDEGDLDVIIAHSADDGTTADYERNDEISGLLRRYGFVWAPSVGIHRRTSSVGARVPTVSLQRLKEVLNAAGFKVGFDIEAPGDAAEARAARAAHFRSRGDSFTERAGKHRRKGDAAYEASRRIGDAIPMGQPVLVGHYSEKRHRRDIDRMSRAMDKSVEHSRAAGYLGERAASREHAAARVERVESRIEKEQFVAGVVAAVARGAKKATGATRSASGGGTVEVTYANGEEFYADIIRGGFGIAKGNRWRGGTVISTNTYAPGSNEDEAAAQVLAALALTRPAEASDAEAYVKAAKKLKKLTGATKSTATRHPNGFSFEYDKPDGSWDLRLQVDVLPDGLLFRGQGHGSAPIGTYLGPPEVALVAAAAGMNAWLAERRSLKEEVYAARRDVDAATSEVYALPVQTSRTRHAPWVAAMAAQTAAEEALKAFYRRTVA